MIVRFSPSLPAGTVKAPPSKSEAHRLLLCAGLSDGVSRVAGISHSADMEATLRCLRALGVTADRDRDTVTVRGGRLSSSPSRPLDCGESGSTLRFFLPIAMTLPGPTVFHGSERLLSRPLGVYETLAAERGILFRRENGALTVGSGLRAGTCAISGAESSQFASGLLFALSRLGGESTLTLLPPVTSRPYVDMTVSALRSFGVPVTESGTENGVSFFLPGTGGFRPHDVTVGGDWSNAAFFLALGFALGSAREAPVTVTGLREDSLQGDRAVLTHLKALRAGCPVIDLKNCPDLAPVLFVTAALFHGATFLHTERLRLKESDRVSAMAEELAKFGVIPRVGFDTVVISGGIPHAPAVPLSSHNDHRVVMALSVLLTRFGGEIRGAEAVAKSYPDFFGDLASLGVSLETLPG